MPRLNTADALRLGDLTVSTAYLGSNEVWPPPSIPTNLVAPTVTGTPSVGQVQTCSTGSWTGTPTSYSYQWFEYVASVWTALIGETANTYTPSGTGTFRCEVVATNGVGSSSAVASNSVNVTSGSWSTRDEWTPAAYEDWTDDTIRQVIDASLLLSGGGSQVRLRLSNGLFYDLAARVYVGVGRNVGNEYAFDGPPVDVTVSGSTAISIVNDGTNYLSVTSDDIALAVPAGRNIVVSAHFPAAGGNKRPAVETAQPGWRNYFLLGANDAATEAATGYSTNVDYAVVLVSRVEQFG